MVTIKTNTTNDGSNKKFVKITKDSNLGEVVYRYPDVAEVLMDYGLHCVGCMLNAYDSIEAGAQVHGMTDQEIEEMVARINEVAEFGE
jgi:hybrid cluster-associated redox disulfide protein